QCELMQSPLVLENGSKLPEFVQLSKEGVDVSPRALQGGLQADYTPKDGIIEVTFRATRPDVAAKVVNGVIDAYIAYQDKSGAADTNDLLELLYAQKEKRSDDLAEAQKALADFERAHPGIGLQDDKGNIEMQTLARFSETLSAAEVQTLNAQSLVDAIKSLNGNSRQMSRLIELERASGDLEMDGEGTMLRTRLSDLQQSLNSERSSGMGERNTAVVELQQQIEDLNQRIERHDLEMQAGFPEMAAQRRDFLAQKEKSLRTAFVATQRKAIEQNTLSAALIQINSNLNRCQKLCDIIDDRIKTLQVNQDVEGFRVGVLERAEAAGAPAFPQPAKSLAGAMLMGLMLGVSFVLTRNWVDQRFRSSAEISLTLSVPVLGVVPRLSRRSFIESAQAVHIERGSMFAEAHRGIRTAIFFGTAGGGGKKILVTSPESGDGKTVTATSQAIAMAQAGQRTLLIDADLRHPAQRHIFEVPNECGLTGLLTRGERIENAIYPLDIPNLHVLPAGPVPMDPSELINSMAFESLLEELSKRYDYIIVDSPPVLSVTDARILAAYCDMTILVLRWNRSTKKAGQEARDALLSVGARIFGGVINDVPSTVLRSKYYRSYVSSESTGSSLQAAATKELAGNI
ncbi:MAG: polysaccharide biosynthesis tyrosine autokinase, partial [Tepidisphaeraceae bacterium]